MGTGLATGSRDKTIKLWAEDGPASFSLTSTLVGHTDYVSALAYTPSGPTGNPMLVSGSRDTSVGVWDIDAGTPAQQLKEHAYQVAAVAIAPSGDIISGSLDKTIRIWRGEKCWKTLEGHAAAVLSLAVLPGGETLVSGSGDCTLRMWSLSQGTCEGEKTVHTDSVRGVAVAPGLGLVTASHDATLKLWTLSGDAIAEMVGHTALVYCCAVSPDGALIASGSEDNTAKVWRTDGECLQTLEHPGCVWDVAFLPNGDLVTACSDAVVRVWSRNTDRRAPQEVAAALEAAMAARKAPAKGNDAGGALPAGLTLEDPSVLQAPGARDGQTKIVSEGGGAVAYSWDAAKATWEKIGDVVAGPDDGAAGPKGARKSHQGREWDYVFDVDVGEGMPMLKLAMDADENPYIVADRFIEANELPTSFKEQIVAFIMQNTGQPSGSAQAGGSFVDPYTGAAAYVPPAPTQQAGGPAAGGFAVTGGGADPFTGGGAAVACHTPAKGYLLFDNPPPVEGLKKRIVEFNAVAPMHNSPQLSEAELAEGGPLDTLLSAVGAPAGSRNFDTAGTMNILNKMLCWDAPQLFPGLDIARMAALDAGVAEALAACAGDVSLESPQGSLGHALCCGAYATPVIAASQHTMLRLVCNLFAQPALSAWVRTNVNHIHGLVVPCLQTATKGVRLGIATLLHNVALMLTKLPGDELSKKESVVRTADLALQACPGEEEEPMYR